MRFKTAIWSYKTLISFRVGAHFARGGQRESFHKWGDSANDASAMFGHNSGAALIGEERDMARRVTHTATVRGS
jgi:hypothetical protein